jgi:glycine cleavage system aminomethyltransferase T
MTDAVEPTEEAPSEQLHETALADIHRGLGARLIEFGGWLMPVQYAGIL